MDLSPGGGQSDCLWCHAGHSHPGGEGTFTINGRPITDYSRKSLEALVGYVPQEHVLFSRTVWENIAMGKVQADQEEIKQAIATAAFEEDVARMADGLDTTIGERGVSISGG